MKKLIIILFSLILQPIYIQAQDVIVKTDESTILGKIEEVSNESIKYRRWDNLEGPLYVLNTSEIISINYNNGSVEVYNDQLSQNVNSETQENANISIIAAPAEDNKEKKDKYDALPKLNIKSSTKQSKYFFPIMAFTDASVISTNEISIIIQPEAVEFYEGGWKVKIGYLISIVNKTDMPIYVDRANSFRIFNDSTSKSYWSNKEVTVSHTNTVGIGAVGILGIAGGSTSSSSHAENYAIDRFIAIAPHSYANLTDYKYIRLSETKALFKTVSDIEYWGFDLHTDSPINVGEIITYSEADSPYSNQYYITYSTDPDFNQSYKLQFELYAKWLVGAKLIESTWSNLFPTKRIVEEVQKILPDFYTNSLTIIGMPGKYL